MEHQSFSNRKSFEDFLKDKTSPIVYCLLTVDGEDFLSKNSFELELCQKTNAHDEFTIKVPDDALDGFEGYLFEHSKELLGKRIVIVYWQYGMEQQRYSGVITGVRNQRNEGGGYGTLFITGHSPSILLENGKVCRSFEQKSLAQIIQEVSEVYSDEAIVKAQDLNNKEPLSYTVQYKESDYEFLQRLAKRYGEYFYYNGQLLVFGNSVSPLIELGENRELIDVEISLEMKSQHFSYLGYDAEKGSTWKTSSQGVQTQWKENAFQVVAIGKSNQLFGKGSEAIFNAEDKEYSAAKALVRERENREGLIKVQGRSRTPALKIGSRARLTDLNDKAMETYRILEIRHHYNGNEYYNEFVGIPDVFHPPYQDNGALPVGEEQMARVVDNADPNGLGRVRVQMLWQEKHHEKTPWLRLVQPHAGAGKGFYFIPELGEEVLVSFEGGNAEKPFVIGTQYNGKEKSGYADRGNRYKVIQTRSNSRLLLDDETGDVTLESAKGQTIAVFYGDGNIEITAPNNITLTAGKSINITAGENISVSAGMNISTSAVMNYTQMVGVNYTSTIAGNASHFITGKLFELIEGDLESVTENERKDFSKGKIEIICENDIKKHARKNVINNSGERSKSN